MNDQAQTAVVASLTFVIGLLAGIGTGLLLAPQSGARTRRQIRSLAEDFGERAGEMAEDAKDAVQGAIDRGKQFVQ
jgi:gas vesicle protein